MDPLDFSYARLRRLYQLSRSRGYRPAFFDDDVPPDETCVYWRHDVDVDLDAALDMARLEAEEGIRSTYFLMVDSVFYNVFAPAGRRVVDKIAELGHRLGLHCDLGMAREAKPVTAEVEGKVRSDFARLTTTFAPDLFCRIVSFHNPSQGVLRQTFTGFCSTYEARFFGAVKYLSDSNRIWREGSPEDWFGKGERRQFAILLHPVIWEGGGRLMTDAVAFFLDRRRAQLLAWLELDDVIVR